MLLKRLVEYAERMELPPVMYDATPIRWYIDLTSDGSLEAFIPLTSDGGTGDRGLRMQAPQLVRASGIRPKLLADNGEYVLGIPRDPDKIERVLNAHEEFKRLAKLCADITEEPSVKAVVAFLSRWDPANPLSIPEDFAPDHNLTFRVNGERPIDLPKVRQFWADYTLDKKNNPTMECIVCGRFGPVERRLPAKVKGVPGGQASGLAIISANEKAFESYGLEHSLIAPTCRDCGEKMAKAANELIDKKDSRVYAGPLVYLFWTKEDVDFSPAAWLAEPPVKNLKELVSSLSELDQMVQRRLRENVQPWEVRDALKAPVTGQKRQVEALDMDAFYATALSASGGRVIVRDWLETTIGGAIANLQDWFARQQLIDWTTGKEGAAYGIFPLSATLYREVKKPTDIPDQIFHAFFKSALAGWSLPRWILAQAIQRNRAEQGLTRPRAVVIKMALLGGRDQGMDGQLVSLETERPETAYHCGRLLAQLEEIQKRAIPSIKQTLIDRYFGAASSSPASVFGVLVRNSQPHLARLRKDNSRRGTFNALQLQLEEIMGRVNNFPVTLDLREQGLFALGYYHQRAANRAARIAYAKRSKDEEGNEDNE